MSGRAHRRGGAGRGAPGYSGSITHENVETVEGAVAALNEGDVEAYLECCTEDVELVMPLAAIGGDIGDTSPDFCVEIEHARPTPPGGVVAFMRVSASGRASGIAVTQDHTTVNVYDFAGGRISGVRICLDRAEAFVAAGLPTDGRRA